MAGVVASMFIDLVLLVMPLPIVVRLQMASRKRIGLVCMFGLGGLYVFHSSPSGCMFYGLWLIVGGGV